MDNFTFYNPTRIVFGRGSIVQLAELVPRNTNVLMLYGGGSIKRNGVYDQVTDALSTHDRIREFGGIQPNPKYELLMEAVALARSENIGFLLAVGGGSVVDGTKFVAAAASYTDGDPWDLVAQQTPVTEALPLGCVMTLPATGSEMNHIAVVSREIPPDKLPFRSEKLFPSFPFLIRRPRFPWAQTRSVTEWSTLSFTQSNNT